MENSAPRIVPSLAGGEKALDTVLSLLETVRCLTSVANGGYQNDARQHLAVGSTPAETINKTLESDEQVRIAILENELKQERAAKEDALSSLHKVLQRYGPPIVEDPRKPTDGFEKADQIKNLKQRLTEENEQLNRRLFSATRQKSGYVEPHSVPETPEKLEKPEESEKNEKPEKPQTDKHSAINDDPFVKQAPQSSLNVNSMPKDDVQGANIKDEPDHLQEMPQDTPTTKTPPDDYQIVVDVDSDFRTLEDILGEDDAFKAAAKRGLQNLDSITGFEAIRKQAPSVLKTGLDAGRVRFANETYALDQVNGRRYDDRRPRGFGMDRHELAAGGESFFRSYRPGVVPGDNPSPDYFKYGLSYIPPTNNFRTVHIGNLPLDIKTPQLISRVRGGQIVSATICDTAKLAGSMSALIVFLNTDEAAKYAQFSNSHAITFESRPATVTLLKTSTWPLSKPSYRRIIDLGQTRCLAILLFTKAGLSRKSLVRQTRDILRQLFRDKLYRAYRRSSIETISLDDDGRIHISFSSVYAATVAFDVLRSPRNYRTCTISFEKDPCSRSLDDLLAPTGPRKGEVREIIPTDGEDLADLNDDELTDIDTEDPGYRRTIRQRYRDADKSPSGYVDELSYSDINNVAVPQFGGPLIQMMDLENAPTAQKLPVTPTSQGPRRRSWADEVNGDESGEDNLESLITFDSPMEEDVIPPPTAQIMVEQIYSETKTAAMDVPKGMEPAEVSEIPSMPAIIATSPKANVDNVVEPSNTTVTPQTKLKLSLLESRIQADKSTASATTPKTSPGEEELRPVVSSLKATALTPTPLKDTTPLITSKTARHSPPTKVVASSPKESTNELRNIAVTTLNVGRAKPLEQRITGSSTGKLKDRDTDIATASDSISSVRNPDEIDLGLSLDSSPIPIASASKPTANIDTMETKTRLISPLIPLPIPVSASAPASEPVPKIFSSGSTSGPSHITPISAIGDPSLNPKKNFKVPGLMTSRYAPSSPGISGVPTYIGIGKSAGTGTALKPKAEDKHALIPRSLNGMEKGDIREAGGNDENKSHGEKRGQPTKTAEATPRNLNLGTTSTKSSNEMPGSSINRGRKLVRYDDEEETTKQKIETKTETKNQVLSIPNTRAKSGSEPSTLTMDSSNPLLSSSTTDATAVAASILSSAAVSTPHEAAALPSSSTSLPLVPSSNAAAPAPSPTSSPSLGSSADGNLAADSGSEGR